MTDPYEILISSPDALPVAADRFEELGRDDEAAAVRAGLIHPHLMGFLVRVRGFSSCFMYGDGDLYGFGDGGADGQGSVQFAAAPAVGDGWGNPFLMDEWFQQPIPGRVTMIDLINGRHYLVAVGGGWMFAARFLRPSGLFGGAFDHVVNICRTEAPWDDLCRGLNRHQAIFRVYPPEEILFPVVLFAVPWSGELPEVSS